MATSSPSTPTGRRVGGIVGVALILQSAGLLTTVAAAAPNSPRVLVVPFLSGEGATQKQSLRFETLLIEDLKTRDDTLIPVQSESPAKTPSTVSAPAGKGGGPGVAAKALDFINDGQSQLNDLKFDEAVTSLQKGIDLMLSDPAWALYDRVLEAYVSMAVAYFRTGDEKKAQAALFQVARLSPSFALPAGKYPPVFVRELDKMKKRAAKAVKGTVVIEGPMGATAFLDGRDLGMVPVTEEDVLVGVHYVKVESANGQKFGQVLDLKGTRAKVRAVFQAGSPVAQETNEAPAGNAMPTALLDANAVYRLTQACKASNARFAIVGFVFRKSDNQLSANAALFSADKQAFSVIPTVHFDAELLTAPVEAFKLAEKLVARMSSFDVTPLPHNLAGKGVAVSSATRSQDADVVPEISSRRPVNNGTDEQPKVAARTDDPRRDNGEGAVRALQNRSVIEDNTSTPRETYDLGPIEKRKPPEQEDRGGVAWWVWAAASVVVVGAAGGTYYGVTQATKPVTGTVTARW